MAKKDPFENLNSVIPTDMAYLLDPSIAKKMNPDNKENANLVSTKPQTLSLDELIPFQNHPFIVNTKDDDFKELVQSIKDNGLICEILVRPTNSGDKYEIISGHRRAAACREAGLTEVPVVIKELSDYQATVLMVHSNLYREKISYSEKAKAYRMIRDAEKHQGVKGVDTATMIGKEHDSKRQVYRYIRLSYLKDELLSVIDAGNIAFQSGVELGFLDEESQDNLLTFIGQTKYYPNMEDATRLKQTYLDEDRSLSFERIVSLLPLKKKGADKGEAADDKATKPKTKISFKTREIEEYFYPGVDPDFMESVILLLLKKYSDGEVKIEDEE